MTPKRYRIIRGQWPTLWPTRSRWPLWSVWPSLDPNSYGIIRGRRDLLYDPQGQLDLSPLPWPTLWPQKVTGSLQVAVTYFMTPKVDLTCDLYLDLLYDPKGHGVIRGRRDLFYHPKSQLDLWPLPWPSLWPQKVTGSLAVAVTYFMTPKVTVTFVVALTYFMTPKCHGVIRGCRDLLCDP